MAKVATFRDKSSNLALYKNPAVARGVLNNAKHFDSVSDFESVGWRFESLRVRGDKWRSCNNNRQYWKPSLMGNY